MKKSKLSNIISLKYLKRGILMMLPGILCSQLSAQDRWVSNFIDTLINNQAEEKMIQVDTINPQFGVLLSIRAHIVSSEDGFTHFTVGDLQQGLDWANQYFKKISIQFHYSSIDTIPEYEYGYITGRDSTVEMEVKYMRKEFIDLFLVDSICIMNQLIRGYASFPGDTVHSLICMVKTVAGGKTLTQLLGNFFGLLDTHERTGGAEHVNEDNCDSSGDFICDTWADPGILGVGENCQYPGGPKDANGEFYVPSVANLMSNAPDDCKCIFTMDQYRRMLYYYQNFRAGLK